MKPDFWRQTAAFNVGLGKRVKAKRLAEGLTQGKLVTLLDKHGGLPMWNVPTLSNIEQGHVVPNALVAPLLTEWLLQGDESLDTCPTCGQPPKGTE